MTIKIIGQCDEQTRSQAQNVLDKGAYKVILCADNHYGYGHPIGGVAAYENKISISGVGYDIACGNMAVKLPMKYDPNTDYTALGREINRKISFGVGRTNDTTVEADFHDESSVWNNPALVGLQDLAASQLGTVGSGNH